MWKAERDLLCLVVVATLAVTTLVFAVEESGQLLRACDPEDVSNPCGNTGRCVEDANTKKFVCKCLRNFILELSSGKCVQRPTTTVPPQPETTTEKLNGTSGSSGNSVAVGLLVPTFLIMAAVLGFCAVRRYGWPCRRNLYGNVLVTREDDDDDPPIAVKNPVRRMRRWSSV